MDPMTLMLISSAVSGGLGMMASKEQQEQAKQDKLLNAQIARYKPWSGAEFQAVTKATSPMQGLTQGALGGAQFGLGLSNAMKMGKMGAQPKPDFASPGQDMVSNDYDPETLALMSGRS